MESQKAGQTAAWLRQGCDLTHDLLHHAGHAEVLALAPVLTHRLQVIDYPIPGLRSIFEFICSFILQLFTVAFSFHASKPTGLRNI